jgi:hypothetical protein
MKFLLYFYEYSHNVLHWSKVFIEYHYRSIFFIPSLMIHFCVYTLKSWNKNKVYWILFFLLVFGYFYLSNLTGRVKWTTVGVSQTGVHNPHFTIYIYIT